VRGRCRMRATPWEGGGVRAGADLCMQRRLWADRMQDSHAVASVAVLRAGSVATGISRTGNLNSTSANHTPVTRQCAQLGPRNHNRHHEFQTPIHELCAMLQACPYLQAYVRTVYVSGSGMQVRALKLAILIGTYMTSKSSRVA